jgi:hypothetical protein
MSEESDMLHRKMDAEIAKLLAETAKLNAETGTIPWLPLFTTVLGSTGVIGAIIALVVAFHK